MAKSNYLFSPTSENLRRFSACWILAKLSVKPSDFSKSRPLGTI